MASLTTNSEGTPLIVEARSALQGLLTLARHDGDPSAPGLQLAVCIVEAIIEREGKRETGGVTC